MPIKETVAANTKGGQFCRPVCKRDATISSIFRFDINSKSFTQQYDAFYETRLRTMKERLQDPIVKKFGSDLPVRQICDVVQNEQCVLIGTLFKHMELQPSVLREISDEIEIPTQPLISENFTSDDDILYLEDSMQRIALSGEIDKNAFVTGVVLAVSGVEEEACPGVFKVDGICLPEMDVSSAPPSAECEILLVSGLEFGGTHTSQITMDLLADYITGNLSDVADESAKICRLYIAGNSISHEVADKEQHYKAKYLTKHTVAGTVDAVNDLKHYLQHLVKAIPITIIPGDSDPSNHILPQQPLHPCMFTDETGRLETATNPYICDLVGYQLLGHSGQPVSNIRRYSKLEKSTDILKCCLQWCHMAPTAPDTLAAYPYTQEDPFVIKRMPRLFFAGNQATLEAEVVEQGDCRCLCLSIPKFSETGIAVKVNLKTLDCQPVCFKPPASLDTAPS